MAVRHRLNIPAVNAMLRSPSGGLARDMYRRGKKVEAQAKRLAPVGKTGRLRSTITTEMVTDAGLPVARIGTNVDYAEAVHDGTGIYGPKGAPIRPKRKRVLRFTPSGASKPVFARQVKGAKPNPFLKDALPAARG